MLRNFLIENRSFSSPATRWRLRPQHAMHLLSKKHLASQPHLPTPSRTSKLTRLLATCAAPQNVISRRA